MSAYVYILGNRNNVLYTGVTNDLERRVAQHKSHLIPGFTQKYSVDRFLYCEDFPDMIQAIAREKQIKGWIRARKLELIRSINPKFEDLANRGADSSLRVPSFHSGTLRSE